MIIGFLARKKESRRSELIDLLLFPVRICQTN
jgi:hypothetical protein